MKKEMKRILVTGALGQIGSELTPALRAKYGVDNVIASDIKEELNNPLMTSGPFVHLDVTSKADIEALLKKHEIDTVFHLAAILSATGEKNPTLCWNVNMGGTLNMLNLAVELQLTRLIIPSSIAVWGPGTPACAPQETALKPTTMYGVTKVAGEVLADYFVQKYKIDCRGLRYPGIISAETFPGGGTTDYAVAIYYEAVKQHHYTCFVRQDTELPMMYMPDCIKATMDLAEADFDALKHFNDFNVGSMSFSVKELADSIKKIIPDFTVDYAPDYRQAIADSWPDSVDDRAAREEWNWSPSFTLDAMTGDMLAKLTAKHEKGLI
jgi:nucleoside-diphosphate-sugar epimerase